MVYADIYWKKDKYSAGWTGPPDATQVYPSEDVMIHTLGRIGKQVWIREGGPSGPLLMVFPWKLIHHIEIRRDPPEPPADAPEAEPYDPNAYLGGV